MTYFLPLTLPKPDEKYYRRGKNIPKGFYRMTMKALIVNAEGKILILREGRFADKKSSFYRSDAGMYDLPGGGLDWGEDFREGLSREMREEIGLKASEYEIAREPLYVNITSLDDRYYDDKERDDYYPVCLFFYPVKVMNFDFHESPECTAYEWVSIEEYKKYPLWSHSKTLEKFFRFEDFPKEYIS